MKIQAKKMQKFIQMKLIKLKYKQFSLMNKLWREINGDYLKMDTEEVEILKKIQKTIIIA